MANPPQSLVITITAKASTAAEAADIANGVAASFATVVADDIEVITPTPGATASPTPTPVPSPSATPADGEATEEDATPSLIRIVTLEDAVPPAAPLPANRSSSPSSAACSASPSASVSSRCARRSTRACARRATSPPPRFAPVLAEIPVSRDARAGDIVAFAGATTAAAEAFRGLRARFDQRRGTVGAQVVVVTSVRAGQGASTVTANLAVALANAGVSVAVVDGDLRRQGVSALFGLADQPGLSDVLTGRAPADAVLRRPGGLALLPAGRPSEAPGELLAGPRMRELIAGLRRRVEVVLIDVASIGEFSDAALLGDAVDATLLVIGLGEVRRDDLTRALEAVVAGGSAAARRRPHARRAPVGAVHPPPHRHGPGAVAVRARVVARRPRDPVGRRARARSRPGRPAARDARRRPSCRRTHRRHARRDAACRGVEHSGARGPDSRTRGGPLRLRRRDPDPDGRRAASGRRSGDVVAATTGGSADTVGASVVVCSRPEPIRARSVGAAARGCRRDPLCRRDPPRPRLPSRPPRPRLPSRPRLPRPPPARPAEVVRARASLSGGRRRSGEAAVPHLRLVEPVAGAAEPAPAPSPATDPSLLDAIGGVPSVEVRQHTTPRPPDARAREAYEKRARELERVAQERLSQEQERVEKAVREQLESGRRGLESVLDNRLDDTIIVR